jgi:hypothetical protein
LSYILFQYYLSDLDAAQETALINGGDVDNKYQIELAASESRPLILYVDIVHVSESKQWRDEFASNSPYSHLLSIPDWAAKAGSMYVRLSFRRIGSDEEDNESDQEENRDSELETAVSRQETNLNQHETTSSSDSNSNGHSYVMVNRSTSNDTVDESVPDEQEKKNEAEETADA